MICDTCKLNFCLTHRHPNDHECKGPSAAREAAASRAGAAAAARAAANNSSAASTQSKITNFFSGPLRTEGAAASRPSAAASRPSAAASRPSAAAAALQNGMSEDEALAAALAASMSDVPPPSAVPSSHNGLSQVIGIS